MKKILSFVLVLVLALSLTAVAAGSPSKTVGDMTAITISKEDLILGPEGLVIIINEGDMGALEELDKLAAGSTEEYFGDDVMTKVNELLGKDEAQITEFMAIYVVNYKEKMGDVKVNMTFPTPIEAGSKAVVLIGLRNDEGAYEWKEFEAIGAEDSSVNVQFDGETLQRIQDKTGLLALAL